jgi:hypothetical protein
MIFLDGINAFGLPISLPFIKRFCIGTSSPHIQSPISFSLPSIHLSVIFPSINSTSILSKLTYALSLITSSGVSAEDQLIGSGLKVPQPDHTVPKYPVTQPDFEYKSPENTDGCDNLTSLYSDGP